MEETVTEWKKLSTKFPREIKEKKEEINYIKQAT